MREIIEILTNERFITAILSSIVFIAVGFFLRKKQLLNASAKAVLTNLIFYIGLPSLALMAFMSDFNIVELKQNGKILFLGFLIQAFLFLIYTIFYRFIDKENKHLYACSSVLGQMTFYSMPFLLVLYNNDPKVILITSLLILSFRFFLYLYSPLVLSKEKITGKNFISALKKVLLNPIVLVTLLSFFLYLIQNVFIQVKIDGISYSILRIDKTLPEFYYCVKTFGNMSSPLAMVLIGVTLADGSFKDVFKDKLVYLISFFRIILSPLLAICLLLIVRLTGFIALTEVEAVTFTLSFAAPVSVTICILATKAGIDLPITSKSCFLSVLFTPISFPIIYLLTVILF